MIDAFVLDTDVKNKNLRRYMRNYLSMMMCICSVFLRMIGTNEAESKRKEIWQYVKNYDSALYKQLMKSILC